MTTDDWAEKTESPVNAEVEMMHCPFCLGEPAAGEICWAIVSPWIRELGVTKRRVCRYLTCQKCKVGWFSLRYSDEGLANLYRNYRGKNYITVRNKWEPWYDEKYNDRHEDHQWMRLRAEAIKSFLRGLVDISKSEVVDVGGDTGQIAELLGAKSFRVVEVSDRVVTSKSETQPLPSIAVLAHVIEHVSFPREFLENIVQNHDAVYVEVPDGIPAITARRKSVFQAALGLLASLFPITWKPFANPSAGRQKPAQLLRVSEHLTFFEQSSFHSLLRGGYLVACDKMELVSPDKKAAFHVLQALWRERA